MRAGPKSSPGTTLPLGDICAKAAARALAAFPRADPCDASLARQLPLPPPNTHAHTRSRAACQTLQPQNNLRELWALLHVLEPDQFPDCEAFEGQYSTKDAEKVGRHRFIPVYACGECSQYALVCFVVWTRWCVLGIVAVRLKGRSRRPNLRAEPSPVCPPPPGKRRAPRR